MNPSPPTPRKTALVNEEFRSPPRVHTRATRTQAPTQPHDHTTRRDVAYTHSESSRSLLVSRTLLHALSYSVTYSRVYRCPRLSSPPADGEAADSFTLFYISYARSISPSSLPLCPPFLYARMHRSPAFFLSFTRSLSSARAPTSSSRLLFSLTSCASNSMTSDQNRKNDNSSPF